MADKPEIHEDYTRAQEVKAGSNRAFGMVFAVVFALIGAFPLLAGGPALVWALAVSGTFGALALAAPGLLKPLNQLWFRFGMLLHKVVNPIIMGLLFFLTVVPTALVMRLMGKDPLRRRFDHGAETYWIERDPPGPEPETMRKQF